MFKQLLFSGLLFTSAFSFAQVGVGTATPNGSAQLDVESTTKGLLPPRMTASQRGAISSPANGLMVYQTDAPAGYYLYSGSTWSRLATSLDTAPTSTSGYAANTSGSVIAVILGGTDINFPNAQNLSSGITINGANTTFTVTNAGRYFITYKLNTTAALLLNSRILLNGSSLAGSVVSPALSISNFQSNVITDLAAGSTLRVQFYGLIGTAILSGDASISIIRLQ
ncbi:MAG: hypothetical protein EOO92_16945 [Pedobacter sp.]|nr:MAG: hypothetical protein EOO92_16945 [Pedobacter sp.]